MADGALRGVAGRPMVLKRFVHGAGGEAFFQKRAPANHPAWIETVELRFPSGRTAEEVVARDAAALAWAVNLGCIDLNPHPVRAADLDHPDELRVDLDPVPGVGWEQILDVAMVARQALESFGLAGWPKTSGSRGFHVYARIEPRWPFADVRRAAVALAREIERRAPDQATSKWWKEERRGVFVDYNQNAKDRTVASAYSVRPMPDARVSTPLAGRRCPAATRRRSPSTPFPRGSPRPATRGRGWTRPPARWSRCSSWPPGTRRPGCPTPPGRRTSSGRPARSRGSSRPSAAAAGVRAREARVPPPAPASRRAHRPPPLVHAADRDRPRGHEGGGDGGAGAVEGAPRGRVRYLAPEDVLVDSMRGRSSTWTRIRSTCSTCPRPSGPARRTLEVDYDPWAPGGR